MDLRVRFVKQDMGETMANQTLAVQSDDSLRKATISDVGLSMMTAIVGADLTTDEEEKIGQSLRGRMAGSFRHRPAREGDHYASVLGEVLGPLFTCLEERGDFTVIRLLWPEGKRNKVKRADLLLIDLSRQRVMLQECKGHCCSWDAVRSAPKSFDVCKSMRKLKGKAKDGQLLWPEPSQLSSQGVRITSGEEVVGVPVPAASRSVVVTAVPDGRLKNAPCRLPSPRKGCPEPCTSCLFSGTPDQEPTVITVLSTESMRDRDSLDPSGMSFLDWYKACERTIWGHAHGSFGQAYSSLIRAWAQLDVPDQTQRVGVSLLTGMMEAAVEGRVFVDFRPIWHACAESRPPEGLMTTLHALHDIQGEMPRPVIREGSARQLGQMLFGMEGERPLSERIIGNWQFSVGGDHVSQEGEGTPVEVCVSKPSSGMIELVVVPQGADQSPSDLRWGLSEILAGDRVPPDIVHEAFVEEEVVWEHIEAGETRRYRLGNALRGPWFPFWPWVYDRRMLEEMRHCCPACDEIAHMLMHWEKHWGHWPESFFFRHDFRRHHHRFPWDRLGGLDFGPLAFVTNDSKAVLRIPYWG